MGHSIYCRSAILGSSFKCYELPALPESVEVNICARAHAAFVQTVVVYHLRLERCPCLGFGAGPLA